jgi:serine acetyltransferase
VDIGCGACVLGDVHIGDDSLIGANAVVTRDVPPWSVVVGVPGYVVKSRLPDEADPEEPANGEYVPRLAEQHRD